MKKIVFTKHANEKFNSLRKYGFEVDKSTVMDVIEKPSRLDWRGGQFLALKLINQVLALRVVYRIVNNNILVITFYSVRRERFNV